MRKRRSSSRAKHCFGLGTNTEAAEDDAQVALNAQRVDAVRADVWSAQFQSTLIYVAKELLGVLRTVGNAEDMGELVFCLQQHRIVGCE